jgi:hypothetical protein
LAAPTLDASIGAFIVCENTEDDGRLHWHKEAADLTAVRGLASPGIWMNQGRSCSLLCERINTQIVLTLSGPLIVRRKIDPQTKNRSTSSLSLNF